MKIFLNYIQRKIKMIMLKRKLKRRRKIKNFDLALKNRLDVGYKEFTH